MKLKDINYNYLAFRKDLNEFKGIFGNYKNLEENIWIDSDNGDILGNSDIKNYLEIIFKINAIQMYNDGIKFYISENNVILTEYIDKKLEDLIFVNQLHKHVEVFFYKDEITFETIYHIKIKTIKHFWLCFKLMFLTFISN